MPVLDTTVFIDLSRRGAKQYRVSALGLLLKLPTAAMTTRFNIAELLLGIELAKDPIAERRQIDDALAGVTVLEFDEAAALQYAKISAHLRRIGRPVADMDRLIASVALANSEAIVTRNPKHFADVPGLVLHTY
jgi:predicted nucleic acid-binding protein